jgi:hypothetical protein
MEWWPLTYILHYMKTIVSSAHHVEGTGTARSAHVGLWHGDMNSPSICGLRLSSHYLHHLRRLDVFGTQPRRLNIAILQAPPTLGSNSQHGVPAQVHYAPFQLTPVLPVMVPYGVPYLPYGFGVPQAGVQQPPTQQPVPVPAPPAGNGAELLLK